jgi:site-specific DNA-cytosine methylase
VEERPTVRVLVACEFSGIVRDAFQARGHDAWSCDFLDTERDGKHLIGDVTRLLSRKGWDLLIAHPPCTHLAVSGAAWFARKKESGVQAEALEFVRRLLDAPIARIALENPVSVISTAIRKPDQIIQPWMFGHPEQKATCLWLKNLPPLQPTNDVREHMMTLPKKLRERKHYTSPGPDRWKIRSRTLQGIADAMADQWGSLSAGRSAQQ